MTQRYVFHLVLNLFEYIYLIVYYIEIVVPIKNMGMHEHSHPVT